MEGGGAVLLGGATAGRGRAAATEKQNQQRLLELDSTPSQQIHETLRVLLNNRTLYS
jgi:hypothetical protein